MTKRTPENTTRMVQENPLAGLFMALPGGIEASERSGQRQLLASAVLPADTGGADAAFVALGFTFGEPVEGDPLFREATLPDGWNREGSDHDMHSYIVDERGIKRVGVFYKAAFYDRRANMHIINVGGYVATEALYGNTPLTAERLALLTRAEIADVRRGLDSMRENIASYPDIYGKYREKLAACDAMLP